MNRASVSPKTSYYVIGVTSYVIGVPDSREEEW